MQQVSTLIIFCLFALSLSLEQEERILGGSYIEIINAPWQVSVRIRGVHYCGGSVIANNAILTAAHCTYGLTPQQIPLLSIQAGTNLKDDLKAFSSNISKIINHPSFKLETRDYDIAILILNSTLPFSKTIAQIELPTEDVDQGSTATVTGWGWIKNQEGSFDSKLRRATVEILSHYLCEMITYPGQVNERMICAGYINGGIDVCEGDGGGPLVQNNKLVGVVSWGDGCGVAGKPSVYTNILYFKTWIQTTLKANPRCHH